MPLMALSKEYTTPARSAAGPAKKPWKLPLGVLPQPLQLSKEPEMAAVPELIDPVPETLNVTALTVTPRSRSAV